MKDNEVKFVKLNNSNLKLFIGIRYATIKLAKANYIAKEVNV